MANGTVLTGKQITKIVLAIIGILSIFVGSYVSGGMGSDDSLNTLKDTVNSNDKCNAIQDEKLLHQNIRLDKLEELAVQSVKNDSAIMRFLYTIDRKQDSIIIELGE